LATRGAIVFLSSAALDTGRNASRAINGAAWVDELEKSQWLTAPSARKVLGIAFYWAYCWVKFSQSRLRRLTGGTMPTALQINLALWAMIICSAMKAAHHAF
jgi:hypothetical protein